MPFKIVVLLEVNGLVWVLGLNNHFIVEVKNEVQQKGTVHSKLEYSIDMALVYSITEGLLCNIGGFLGEDIFLQC